MIQSASRYPLLRDCLNGMRHEIAEIAADQRISELDLRLRLGLHLPRLFRHAQWPDKESLSGEAIRLALQSVRLQTRHAELAEPFSQRDLGAFQFRELRGAEVDLRARPILEAFHYLRSFREKSRHFGLTTSGDRVAALLTLSPFDLNNFLPVWESQGLVVRPDQLQVVSRIYVFRGAPRNAISHMLKCVRRLCAVEQPAVDGFVTYLNPNLGLCGVSYAASGFNVIAREAQWGAAYVDGNYVTVRAIERMTGLSDPGDQCDSLGARLNVATFPLMPLELFGIGWRRLRKLNQLKPEVAEPWVGMVKWTSFWLRRHIVHDTSPTS